MTLTLVRIIRQETDMAGMKRYMVELSNGDCIWLKFTSFVTVGALNTVIAQYESGLIAMESERARLKETEDKKRVAWEEYYGTPYPN